MAEQILPPHWAAMLERSMSPERQRELTLAAALEQGLLNPDGGSGPIGGAPPQPMLPTLSGVENQPRPQINMAEMLQSGAGAPTPPPTTGVAAMPQSPQEAEDLASGARFASAAGAVSGFSPAMRTGQALSEGRVADAAGNAAMAAAPWVAGPLAGRAVDAVRASPTLASLLTAGGIGGLIGLSEPESVEAQRAPRGDPAIMAEQRELSREGFYDGPIDGLDRERTQAARKAAAAARTQKLEKDRAFEMEKAGSEAERERLKLQQQETKLRSEEAERNANLVREGTARLNEQKQTPWEKARPYAAPAFGAAMGLAERGGLGWLLGRQRRALNQRADDLSQGMGQGDVPERVGRVNQFWSEGAPNSPPPFAFQSGRQPYPWANDPASVAPNELFRSSGGALQRHGPIGITGLTGGAEIGGGMYLLGPAQEKVAEARRAVQAPNGATPANVRNMQQAEEELEQAKWMIRMGFGHIGGGVMGEMKGRIVQNKTRPSVQRADTERGRVDQLINPANRGLTAAELTRRRRNDGPLPGGHYVDPAAPPTPGETWSSPRGNKIWTRDDNGRFHDESGQLMTDPRTNRRGWRRLSSADENAAPSSGGMAEFLMG